MGELVPAFFRSVVQTQRDQGNSTTKTKESQELQGPEKERGGGNQVIGTGVDTQMCPFLEPIKQVVNMKAPYCLINA